MGEWRRVIHNGAQIIGVEHRADEYQLGAAAYTLENILPQHAGAEWFVQDVVIFNDAEGVIPWDALSVDNPGGVPNTRKVAVDGNVRDTVRQRDKDRQRGGGWTEGRPRNKVEG